MSWKLLTSTSNPPAISSTPSELGREGGTGRHELSSFGYQTLKDLFNPGKICFPVWLRHPCWYQHQRDGFCLLEGISHVKNLAEQDFLFIFLVQPILHSASHFVSWLGLPASGKKVLAKETEIYTAVPPWQRPAEVAVERETSRGKLCAFRKTHSSLQLLYHAALSSNFKNSRWVVDLRESKRHLLNPCARTVWREGWNLKNRTVSYSVRQRTVKQTVQIFIWCWPVTTPTSAELQYFLSIVYCDVQPPKTDVCNTLNLFHFFILFLCHAAYFLVVKKAFWFKQTFCTLKIFRQTFTPGWHDQAQ